MKILIANDHGGVQAKRAILEWLDEHGYEYEDFGSETEEIVRYPYFAARVAQGVSQGKVERGILICATGIGMSIVANKFPGVRASVCMEPHTAHMTRLHNDSNILCLGGKTLGVHMILSIMETWLTTQYMGQRHEISLGLIREIEKAQIVGACWDGRGNSEYPW